MATISNVNGKKITKIKYKGEIYDTGGGGATSTLKTLLDATKSTYNLFYQYSGTSVNGLISYSDTENVTNMSSMYHNCENLTTIPQLDTSSVISMSSTFQNCKNLTTIQLDTSNVTSFYYTFAFCDNLKTIDITHILTTANTYYFANKCFSLTKLIIRNMTTLPKLDSSAFNGCYHFTGTTNATYNPQGLKDGRIYVPDDKVDALKTETNWSVYADIIVPLSTLVE